MSRKTHLLTFLSLVPPEKRHSAPPIDRAADFNRFKIVRDRRGCEVLAAHELDGSLVAIIPGGTRMPSPPDKRDLPLLWRCAHWRSSDGMARDRAPDFVLDIGLAALVDCHQAHAEWMLERSSRQLGCIVDLLGRIAHDEDDRIATDAAAQAALLAYRRALFVRGELKVATEQYSRQTQRPAPLHVEQALKKAKDAFERAQVPLKCIEELIGCGGHVTLRRTLWRWRGDAHGAALVFLKLHEAERALAERRSTRFIHDRFRLLERALDQAGGGSRTALTPAKRHCAYALQRINEERWTPRRQDRVHRLLIREMYWLYRRMKMSQPGVPPRTGQSRHVPAGPLGKSAERNIATTPG